MSSSPKLAGLVDSAMAALEREGIVPVQRRDLVNGIQVRFSEGGSWCRINFYHSRRRGFSIVPAGGDSTLSARVSSVLEGGEEHAADAGGGRIGSDEAGKGDYLGPLTAAAVFGRGETVDELVRIGVTDSKRLGDETVRKLAGQVLSRFPDCCSVVSVPPEEYNREFARLKAGGRNSLDLLAICHARAIGELFERGHSPTRIVIDRFCPPARISHLLPAGDYRLELPVGGESDPVVAAASILARNAYLQGLDLISERWGIRAMSGSGAPTDTVARRFVEEYGGDVLARVAKLHFRNTERALNPPT